MLLAKSCHDLDWISYIMGTKAKSVSSFGSLKHFRKDEKPADAGNRCLKCKIETKCPYSAKRFYFKLLDRGSKGWPLDVLTPEVNKENIQKALETGQYGRCVYECDNDVVDNQIVNILFQDNKTASFTMTAFCEDGGRKTRIHGTKGEIYGDGNKLDHYDYLTEKHNIIDTDAADSSILGGHGGGDFGLMKSFIEAVGENDETKIISGPNATLESHMMVFAAEKARLEERVVKMEEFHN